MKKLFKKAWRDMMAAKGQYIAITIVMALGVAFFCGVLSASTGVAKNVEAFYKQQYLGDLWAYTAVADEGAIEEIRAIDGVVAAEGRVLAYGANGEAEFVVHTLPPRSSVNAPLLERGRLIAALTQCIIDRGFADTNGINIGDVMRVTIGADEYDLTVVGVFNSPEYLLLMKSITDITPDHHKFGAIFVADGFFGDAPYNEIVIKTEEGADLEAVMRAVEEMAAPYGLQTIITREKVLSWTMLNDDINQFSQVGKVFPVFFFVVAAIIIFISMSKNVETQRQQIGNMKALGIKGGQITFHFLSYTFITASVGIAVGAVVGVLVITPFIQGIFTALYTMPKLQATGFGGNVAVAAVLCVAFGGLATIISARKPLKESAAAAMRPKAPKKVNPIILEKNQKLWARIPFGQKIMWRNLLLNKTRVGLSAIGLIGCIGLLLAAFGFMDSINDMIGEKFEDMYRCDAVVSTKVAIADYQFPLESDDVAKAWGQSTITVTMDAGDNPSVDLIALNAGCDAVALYSPKGERLGFPTNGVLIPKKFQEKYGLKTGETLGLTIMGDDGVLERYNVKIVGIAMEYMGQSIYTSMGYMLSMGMTPQVTQFFVTMKDGVDIDAATERIRSYPDVKVVMTKDEIMGKTAQSMGIMKSLVYILVAASGVLALTVVYNISAINIFERRRDIATLKVLGYHAKEVNRLVFTENLIITGIGAVFGIGAGYGLLYLIIKMALTDTIMAPMVVLPLSIVYAVALGFVFTMLANFLLRGKIRGIDMVESLKSAE